MGSQIALAYIGVMIAPPMFGLVNSIFGSHSFPIFVSLLYIIMVIAILYLVKRIRFEGKYNKEI
jgi:fucose permease